MNNMFEINNIDDTYSFIHLKIENPDEFYQQICEYLLDEKNLLQYVENETSIEFNPSKKNYYKLYKLLFKFIDDEIMNIEIDDELKEIIVDEVKVLEEDDKKIKIRLSKIGRIGEYMNHLILSKYFQLSCVIPKIALTTDKNMSVFGIDELFFDEKKNILFFGESKVSKNLNNGIKLLKKSLKEYHNEIKEEFRLVLSEEKILKHPNFKVFQDKINQCISFDEFVSLMEINEIGIPLFIAHGTEVKKEEIHSALVKIKKEKILNLKTQYIIISLPIISKNDFVIKLTSSIRKKMMEYENAR